MQSISLNVTQTVFTLFWAIAWGMIANVQPRWRAFDWARASDHRVCYRVWLSVLFFNIVPIVFFLWLFWLFTDDVWQLRTGGFWEVFFKVGAGIAPSFAIFGLYRIWLGVIEWKTETFYWWGPTGFLPYENATETVNLELDDDARRSHSRRNIVSGLIFVDLAVAIPTLAFWIIRCANL